MHNYTDLFQRFNQFLNETSFDKHPHQLYQPFDYIMQLGGKRFRPVLVLMGFELFSEDIEKALPVALAVEVFHNFSLVHDDIMDEAPIRRGHPSVHAKYGLNTGILSGDIMLINAYKMIVDLHDTQLVKPLLEVFNELAVKVCEGQQYDINFETQHDVSIDDYLLMIEYKTAALMAGALKMGALLGGASPEEADHLYEFGRNVGIGFQLQDDILDTFGDPQKVGKKAGGDIIQNKKTYLYLKALELAEGAKREQLISYYHNKSIDENEKIGLIVHIFNELKIKELAQEKMNTYLNKAFDHLDKVSIENAKKESLKDLANKFIRRDF